MKKWVITTTIFLSAIFIMIPKANAQIQTAFGNFPDAPTDYYNHVVSQYLIMQDKSDTSNVQMFALGRYSSGNRSCSYSSIATGDPNFMWLNGVKTSGGNTCYGNYYTLENNEWVWQSYISAETSAIPTYVNRLGNKPYTDYNIATTINFTYNSNVLVPADSGFPTISLLVSLQRPTSSTGNLLVTLDDLTGLMGTGSVYYSYNNSDWYTLDLHEGGDTATLPVYTNGLVYFKITDSNDSIIYTRTYNVTGMPSMSGYEIHEIPAGNYNIYISNISSNTGNFYFPVGSKGFSQEFKFLSSTGVYLGSQYLNYISYDDIEVDTVSFDGNGFVSVPYNFTDYTDTKVIMFNYNSDSNLIIWIPTGYYLDYVLVSSKVNYICEDDTNITNSVNLSSCILKFDINDNGTISEVTDETTNYESNKSTSFFGSATEIVKNCISWFIGFTLLFSNFLDDCSPMVMYCFYSIVILFVVWGLISLFRH